MATINQKLNLVLYNYRVKQFLNFVLKQRFIYQNSIYQKSLKNKIEKVVNQYQSIPFSLRIENTNFCNGRCFMCPYPTMKREKGIMSRELYQKIIDQAEQLNIRYINLHNFGEPLVDTDFVWKVKYAKLHHIERISTNTNGSLLNLKLNKQLILSGLDELYISVDAATQKTYQKIRIGLPYQKVVKNIKSLVKLKKQLKSDHPKIILDFLKFDLNQSETQKFIKKWETVVDSVCISQIHDWSNKKQIKTGLKTPNYVQFSQSPCRLPFTEMLINWDGTVSLCCQDIDGENLIGDIKNQTISQIWQNKKYQKIRQLHLQLKTETLPLCKNCKLRTFWWTF
jgi:radical SAM protein with 4Fe4S-binding SPASM domain